MSSSEADAVHQPTRSEEKSGGWLRRHLVRFAALALILITYGFTRPPALSGPERAELAARFLFDAVPIDPGAGAERQVRPVHPSLDHIASWISAVGAGVALNDVDGDGLANDLCLIDPRADAVTVQPVPGSGDRYPSIPLVAPPVPGADPATIAPMGCLPGDLNEDGSMDLVVYYWGRPPVAFLARQPPGTAVPLSAERWVAVPIADPTHRWFTNAATLADVDGDGHADLVIGNYFQDGASVLDARGVGWQAMQDSMSRAMNGGFNRILRWTGSTDGDEPTVRFEEVPEPFAEEVARGWTLALAAGDLDGDLLPEVYFANDFGPDRLLHNRSRPGEVRFALIEGERGFRLPASKHVGHDSFKSMGVEIADLDRDGWFDLYVSNIAADFALHESHFAFLNTGRVGRMADGVAPFVDRSERLGLARSGFCWEARLADFDNDGTFEALQATGFIRGARDRWPELHELAMGNDELIRDPRSWPRFKPGDDLSGDQHNPFFVRSSRGRYFDLAPEIGIDRPQVSRGIATADVDGDGRLDFAVANQWEDSYFYRNRAAGAGDFLGLSLLRTPAAGVAVEPGLAAPAAGEVRPIGARAAVNLPGGRRLVAQIDGGNGHSGKRSHDIHFGLGAGAEGRRFPVEISWRDSSGRVRRTTLELSAGWHTVRLGDLEDGGSSTVADELRTTDEKGTVG